MLSFGEMIYVFAVLTLCFVSCVFKTKFLMDGSFGNVAEMYIVLTFLLFTGTVLLFIFIRKKCAEYKKEPQREVFFNDKKTEKRKRVGVYRGCAFLCGEPFRYI